MIEEIAAKGDTLQEWLQRRMSLETLDYPVSTVVTLTVCLLLYLLNNSSRVEDEKVPTVGRRYAWEPDILLRLRFIRGSRAILRDGYRQVNLTTLHQ